MVRTDELPAEQRAMSEAGDRLGRRFEQAGNHWALGEDVPREVWRQIGETASLIAAYAGILSGPKRRTRRGESAPTFGSTCQPRFATEMQIGERELEYL